MIVPMIKYSFVLFYKDYEAFLAQLQELGLVDITVSGWEPSEDERRLMTEIDQQRKAMKTLAELRKNELGTRAEAFDSPEEALRHFVEASAEIDRLHAEAAKLQKEIADLEPWGDFSKARIDQLAENGIKLHLFTAFTKEFDLRAEGWKSEFAVEEIARKNGVVYFAIVTGRGGQPVEINATEVKMPERTAQERKADLTDLYQALETERQRLERAAESLDELDEYGKQLREQLDLSRVNTSALRQADGALVVMEGWAPAEAQEKVDAFLADDETAYTTKEEPQAEDEPPVLLKNNRFARAFEFIGGFYSLPRYGTMDLTPFFAPFYMIFFGFCLADAGYGSLYVIAAIIARFKVSKQYQGLVTLAMMCGLSTIFFGLLTGNAFGIQLAEQPLFQPISRYMINSDQLFNVAIGVGVVHILYAMCIKVFGITKRDGFRYALSSLGWLIFLLSGLCGFILPEVGIEGYALGSIPFWITAGIGLCLMFFFNSPGKNPFFNFGLGIWNTYNDVTGLLSDVLSYIRLFALGLSGGILALVFNRLALEMSPDIIIFRQIVMILILAVGQGITLFMASLSAFVHPLRLTFVEFYKNAGFVDGGRPFQPLKKEER
ncbi:MAG: V-type ATP synthase subunit I [Rikenellaceae bacterium]|jgi:V/A-type H+-transporting ATPase subunit I|nr:V-type ATP synthase subunit I [Rikenellaceae bacterium]